MKTLLLFVRAASGCGFDAFRIDAMGLSTLGRLTTDHVLRGAGGKRPDGVAVCSPLDPEAHAFVHSMTGWMMTNRIPLFSLWTSERSPIDPFKVYEAVWGLIESEKDGSPAAA